METFKSFTATSNDGLDFQVNEWRQAHSAVKVIGIMFSTNAASELIEYRDRPEMVGPASTEYHVAIWYRE